MLAVTRRVGRRRLAEIFAVPRGLRSFEIVDVCGQILWRVERSVLATPKRFRVEVTEGGGRPVGTVRLRRLGLTRGRYLFHDGAGELIGNGEPVAQPHTATTMLYRFRDGEGRQLATSKYPVTRAPHRLSFDSAISQDLRALTICLVTVLPNRRLAKSAPVPRLLERAGVAPPAADLLGSGALTFHRGRMIDTDGRTLADVGEPHVPIRRVIGRFATANPGLNRYEYAVTDPSGGVLFRIDKSGWTQGDKIGVKAPDGTLVAAIKKSGGMARTRHVISDAAGASVGRIDQAIALTQEYTTRDAHGVEAAAYTRATVVDEPWTIAFSDDCSTSLRMATLAFIVAMEQRLDL